MFVPEMLTARRNIKESDDPAHLLKEGIVSTKFNQKCTEITSTLQWTFQSQGWAKRTAHLTCAVSFFLLPWPLCHVTVPGRWERERKEGQGCYKQVGEGTPMHPLSDSSPPPWDGICPRPAGSDELVMVLGMHTGLGTHKSRRKCKRQAHLW